VSVQAVRYFSDVRSKLPPDVDGWGYSLRGMMSMVVGFGFLIIALREYLERTAVRKIEGDLPKLKKKKKTNMSVGESFVFLAKSTYIRCMATLVVAYGISINLVEVTWKSKLKAQYPNPNDYSTFMGNFSTATGALSPTSFDLSLDLKK
jgi:ATP:ADP antiporter, AAA family